VTGQDFTAPEARAALRRRLREECAEIKDRDTRAQYEADLNTRFEKVFPTATSQPSGARGPYSGKFQAPSVKPSAQGPTGDRKLRVLIVTLINHPALLDDTQEFLAHQDCADPRLSALQQDLAATPVREPGALRAELHAAGHTETLDALWQDAQLRLSKFAFDPQRGEDAAAFVAEMQG
jgi:DNA primase